MKVGILTFHAELNCGAVLQAYALQSFLQARGHDVEFIDFRRKKKIGIKSFIGKGASKTYNRTINTINGFLFSRGFNSILKVSSKTYMCLDEMGLECFDYDLIIVGSDQVWNGYNEYSPVYYCDFIKDGEGVNLISYAASMGQCSNIPCEKYNEIKNWLDRFKAVSVREQIAANYLKSMGYEKSVSVVCDPTLLADVSVYRSLILNVSNKPKIVSYILMEKKDYLVKIIDYIVGNNSDYMLNIRNPSSCVILSDYKNKIVNPVEFLSYIFYSEFVICSSFHAVVFSLLFNKNFVAIELNDGVGNVRVRELLNRVGLIDRCVDFYDEKLLSNLIHNTIDWNLVNKQLQLYSNTGKDYLSLYV